MVERCWGGKWNGETVWEQDSDIHLFIHLFTHSSDKDTNVKVIANQGIMQNAKKM